MSPSRFDARITADPGSAWPVEARRYRLVASRACPFASRAVVSRRLLGLEDAISLAVVDPIQDDRGWSFALGPGGRAPVRRPAHRAGLDVDGYGHRRQVCPVQGPRVQ
ncbi:hypothetical protein AB0C32_44225, partial [Streptosporangium sp. NPDC048865]